MTVETVGGRLEASARDHGWTLAEFAAKLGVSYETVRKWRAGKTAPNRGRQKQIADLLGKPAEWVMYGSASAPAATSSKVRLSATEERLLFAYRQVLIHDQEEALASLEKRANEVAELTARITTERFDGTGGASRKRDSA